jgi:chemotaxis protein CheX
MTSEYRLAATLNTAAADELRQALSERVAAMSALSVDGAAVDRIGQACLQVLASARATAAAQGLRFRLDPRSDALAQMIALAGLDDSLAPVD